MIVPFYKVEHYSFRAFDWERLMTFPFRLSVCQFLLMKYLRDMWTIVPQNNLIRSRRQVSWAPELCTCNNQEPIGQNVPIVPTPSTRSHHHHQQHHLWVRSVIQERLDYLEELTEGVLSPINFLHNSLLAFLLEPFIRILLMSHLTI